MQQTSIAGAQYNTTACREYRASQAGDLVNHRFFDITKRVFSSRFEIGTDRFPDPLFEHYVAVNKLSP